MKFVSLYCCIVVEQWYDLAAVIMQPQRDRSRSPSALPDAGLVLCNVDMNALVLLHATSSGQPVSVPSSDIYPCGTLIMAASAVASWRQSDELFCSDLHFHLQDKSICIDHLKVLHPFDRDRRCVFNEVDHVYVIDGITRAPWSASRMAHMCMEPFDGASILDRYYTEEWARRKGYVDATGAVLDRAGISMLWHRNGLCQSRRGTLMHWHIECILNGYTLAMPHSPEISMFFIFKREFLDFLGLVPHRTEMSMFHCGLCLAGQADFICRDINGTFVIIDWKRCKSIDEYGFNGKVQLAPLDHLPHCNFMVYSLQLNIYRHILESEYGLSVSGMYLVVLHPDQWPLGPHVYQVDRMEAEIELLCAASAAMYGVSAQSVPGADALFDVSKCHFSIDCSSH